MKNIKKAVFIRFMIIGALHTFLYMWLVPFAIYPRFGDNGLLFTVIVAVIISLSTLGTLFIGKRDSKKYEKSGEASL